MILSDIAIRRPVFTTMAVTSLLLFGILGYLRMGVDLYPEVDFPMVTVTTTLKGASAEVMDVDVTDVLEEKVNTIEGIESITSTSAEGISQIVAEFVLEKDVDIAAQEVREKVALAAGELPSDVDPPIVAKIDISGFPFMWIAVSGTAPYKDLSRFAEKVVKERIQSLPGVGAVQLGGFRKREIRIWLDNNALEAHSVTVADVIRALREKNVEVPGGIIESQSREFSVRTKGEFESYRDFTDLVIAQKNGVLVRLKQVGAVQDDFEDLRSIARYNRKTSVGLGVIRKSGTNTVQVADAVRSEIQRIARNLPAGITLDVAFDQSKFIRESIHDVQFDILFGALLTSLVMLVFLRNLRTTLISVIAIPTSLISTFTLMNAMGFTINNLTMLGISLAVGMVIDDAIVVLENTFRHMEEGKGPLQAAREGVGEIAFAVMAATFSIAAVFIPVAFMKGMIGRFFFEFGLTVTFSILVSLFISLTLTPMMCSRYMRESGKHGPVFRAFEKGFAMIDSLYRGTLRVALRVRFLVVVLALVAFMGGLFMTRFIGKEFVSQGDESRFVIRFESATGSSLEHTETYMERIERILFSSPEVKSAFLAIGLGETGQVNKGTAFVNMIDRKERRVSQVEYMKDLRKTLAGIPGISVSVENLSPIGSRRNSDIEYILQGPDLQALARYSQRIMERLKASGGFVDVDSNLELTKPEVQVLIDRNKADDLNVDVRTIATTVNALIGGTDATKYKEGGERYDVRVRLSEAYRKRPRDIENLLIRSQTGQLIRLGNLIEVREGAGPNLINRYNRQRSVTVYGNLEDKPLGQAHLELDRISAQVIPEGSGYKTAYGGRGKRFKESFEALFSALVLAILITYMILAAQFESFIHPFTVMLSLPLCVVGAFGALLLTGSTLNIFSYIGIIMLMGIVTRNAILLVDYTNTLRSRGMPREEAVLTAGPIRLRPILMTATATIVGVIPVALALSAGGEVRAPMARAVIGGMMTSTFLTLLVVPVVYTLLDDLQGWIRRIVQRGGRRPGAEGEGRKIDG